MKYCTRQGCYLNGTSESRTRRWLDGGERPSFLLEKHMIAIDFESHLIGNNSIFPKPVCLSWYDGKETGLLDREEARKYLHEILIKKEMIVAHNAVFECGVIVTQYPELTDLVFDALDEGLFYCTKINESLNNIQREKKVHDLTLAGLVKHYFKEDISETKTDPDAWRLRYSELDGIPIKDWPKKAVSYAIDDSIWAYKVQQNQEPIKQNLALKSAVYLNLMGAQGFRIKKERVEKLESEIWGFLTPHYDYLVERGFCDYIINQKQPRKQTKKLKEYVEGLGIVLQYTDKGNTSMAGESIDAYLVQIDDPVLRAFSTVAKYEKILTAYLSRLRGAEKIYSQYSTDKNSGRTSSNGSKLFDSVNIQQMPRKVENVTYDVRNCFMPRPGFKIFSIDYGALELRAVAHQLYSLLGYSNLRNLLNQGDRPTDPHSILAARMKKIEYYEDFKKDYKEDRDKAKEVSLGLPGGMGYDTIRGSMWSKGVKTYYQVLEKSYSKRELQYYLYNLGSSDLRIKRLSKNEYALVQDEIVNIKRFVFELYPELEQFLKEEHKRFLNGKNRWIKNEFDEWEEEPLYRYQVGDFVRDNCTYTAICNGYLMQSPSAQGAQMAMNKMIRTYWNHPDVIPQAFIHDEVVGEVREDCYDQLDGVANIMMEEMQKQLPSVRIAVEASVSDYWQKADGFYNKTMWLDAK